MKKLKIMNYKTKIKQQLKRKIKKRIKIREMIKNLNLRRKNYKNSKIKN